MLKTPAQSKRHRLYRAVKNSARLSLANDSYRLTLSSTDASGQTTTTFYDALGRAYIQVDANRRQSQTIYDKRGFAIETRSESSDENGSVITLVSRTIYDESGRTIYTTGSFPADTAPSEIICTRTIYDNLTPTIIDLDGDGNITAEETFGGQGTGRMLASVQFIGIDIAIISSSSLKTHASSLLSAGTVVSFSSSIYDDAGRVARTIRLLACQRNQWKSKYYYCKFPKHRRPIYQRPV